MLLLEELDLLQGIVQLFLSVRAEFLLLIGQLLGFVGFPCSLGLLHCHNTLLLLGFVLVLGEGL